MPQQWMPVLRRAMPKAGQAARPAAAEPETADPEEVGIPFPHRATDPRGHGSGHSRWFSTGMGIGCRKRGRRTLRQGAMGRLARNHRCPREGSAHSDPARAIRRRRQPYRAEAGFPAREPQRAAGVFHRRHPRLRRVAGRLAPGKPSRALLAQPRERRFDRRVRKRRIRHRPWMTGIGRLQQGRRGHGWP